MWTECKPALGAVLNGILHRTMLHGELSRTELQLARKEDLQVDWSARTLLSDI
jgi:hypothetical protein